MAGLWSGSIYRPGLPDQQIQPLFIFPARPQITGLPASDDSEFRMQLDQLITKWRFAASELVFSTRALTNQLTFDDLNEITPSKLE